MGLEKNWWEAVNDRKPEDHELAATSGADDDNGAVVPAVPNCACLQCGALIPAPKKCSMCKLAAYCSKDCQRQHWQRHKPRCVRLQEAERDRAAKGQPRPPVPAPDPPLMLTTSASQMVFRRDEYQALLEAHHAGRRLAAATASKRSAASAGDVAGAENSADHLAGWTNGTAQQGHQGHRELLGSPMDGSAAASESALPSSSSLASSSSCPSSAASTSPPLSQSPPPRSLASGLPQQQRQNEQQRSSADGSVGSGDGPLPWPASWPPPPSPPLLTPPRPAGILNTGNTCYAACAVQALLATPGLGEYLRSGVHFGECTAAGEGGMPPGVSSWCPACELSRLAAAAAASVAPEATAAAAAAAAADSTPATANGGASGPSPAPNAWAAGAAAGRAWPWSRPRPAAAAAVDARRLTENVPRLSRTLVPGRQEDAHELLAKLLEALAEVQLAAAGGRRLLRARAAAKRRKEEEEAVEAARSSSNGSALPPPAPRPVWRGDETSLVHHVLGGYLRKATLCDCCGHVSQSHEPVLGLEVDLGRRVGTVEAGLRGFFADDVLDEGSEYKCERCRQVVCATRRLRLEVAPNVLAITLKRFAAGAGAADDPGGWGPRAGKDARPIALHMDLNLTPYMARGSLDPGPATYRLYGVVQHLGIVPQGSMGGVPSHGSSDSGGHPHPRSSSMAMAMSMHMGHYVAVVRGGDGGWYRCDDDEVTKVSESEVESITDGYLLFYERTHPYIPGEGRGKDGGKAQQTPQQQQEEEQAELELEVAATDGEEEEGARPAGAAAVGMLVLGSPPSRPPGVRSHVTQGEQQPQATAAPLGQDEAADAAKAEAGPPADAEATAAAWADPLHASVPLPSTPSWSAWLQADAGPHAGKAATVGVAVAARDAAAAAATAVSMVCPSYRLRLLSSGGVLPSGGSSEEHQWALRVRLPGVKAARDVRLAATCPPPAQSSPPPGYAAANGGGYASVGDWHDAGRVRVWVVGRYSLDVQLALRRRDGGEGAGAWQLAVLGGEQREEGAAVASAATDVEVEVLQPRWGPASCTLHVPLQLRRRLASASSL